MVLSGADARDSEPIREWDGGAAGMVGGSNVLCGNAGDVRGTVGASVAQRVELLQRRRGSD